VLLFIPDSRKIEAGGQKKISKLRKASSNYMEI
jgi:hypothetical protein